MNRRTSSANDSGAQHIAWSCLTGLYSVCFRKPIITIFTSKTLPFIITRHSGFSWTCLGHYSFHNRHWARIYCYHRVVDEPESLRWLHLWAVIKNTSISVMRTMAMATHIHRSYPAWISWNNVLDIWVRSEIGHLLDCTFTSSLEDEYQN